MSTDPVSYIFGIIRYIRNRIRVEEDNIEYNPSIKAVGSCVRALLHYEDYIDISLVISCSKLINQFISICQATEILTFHENISGNYKILRILYKNKSYTVFIANKLNSLPNYNACFGLTCNNLSIDFDGNISTIISNIGIKKHSCLSWTTSCIQDAISGKFRVIVLDRMNTLDRIIMYNDICQNMIHLGFVFDRDNSKDLTSYPFIELKSHVDIKEFYPERVVSESCCICREQYASEPDKSTILVGCLHDFHIDCLQKWVQQPQHTRNSCPVCRTDLKYEPCMLYGDNEADEIIRNHIIMEVD